LAKEKPNLISDRLLTAWRDAVKRRRSKDELSTLKSLWRAYNTNREHLGRLPMSTARMAGPYLLGFHMPNFLRAIALLNRVSEQQKIVFEQQTIQLFDLGCGTGAASLALCQWLKNQSIPEEQLRVELIDRSKPLVDAAVEQFRSAYPGVKIRTARLSLDDPKTNHILRKSLEIDQKGIAILSMAYVWNEIQKSHRSRSSIEKFLLDCGKSKNPFLLLFLEPAHELSSKSAMKLRDHLAKNGWRWLYPCPRILECPLRNRQRDWCYSEFVCDSPLELRKIERILGIKRTVLGTSGYFAANGAALRILDIQPQTADRILVGRPVAGESKYLLICSGAGLEKKQVTSHENLLRGQALV